MDCSINYRRASYVPLYTFLQTPFGQSILLVVVEVILDGRTRVCLEGRRENWTQMNAVVLAPSLEEESLWLHAGYIKAVEEIDK